MEKIYRQQVSLCEKAQTTFEAFCTIPVVPVGQLFGGKIIAALDRQHPRDLFDVKYLLGIEGFTQEIKKGFLLFLLCSDRPINEVIIPHFPAINWKLQNLQNLRNKNPDKHREQYEILKKKLNGL